MLPRLLFALLLTCGCVFFEHAPCAAQSGGQIVAFEPLQAAPRPPKRGIAGIVVGSVASGLTVLNLAAVPLCSLDYYEENDMDDFCRVSSFVFAGAFATAAIVALSIGIPRRRAYKAWQRQHRMALEAPRITPTTTGLQLAWGMRF
jgi:hypothetical protein